MKPGGKKQPTPPPPTKKEAKRLPFGKLSLPPGTNVFAMRKKAEKCCQTFQFILKEEKTHRARRVLSNCLRAVYTMPCAFIAWATFSKPAMLAPTT